MIFDSVTRRISGLWSARKGSLAVEFALSVPIFLLALGGAADYGWLLLAEFKARQVAATMADLTGRSDVLTTAEATDILRTSYAVGSPLRMETDGRVIVTHVRTTTADGSFNDWRVGLGGGDPGSLPSRVGELGDEADLGSIVLPPGENMVVAEVVLHFRPLIGLAIREERDIYATSYSRPRFGIVALDDD